MASSTTVERYSEQIWIHFTLMGSWTADLHRLLLLLPSHTHVQDRPKYILIRGVKPLFEVSENSKRWSILFQIFFFHLSMLALLGLKPHCVSGVIILFHCYLLQEMIKMKWPLLVTASSFFYELSF